MPMTFPDMNSLMHRATMRNFRQPLDGESEHDYREAFAGFMQNIDMVEAGEIRLGAIPLNFASEHSPMLALSAMMGKSPSDIDKMMNDILGS